MSRTLTQLQDDLEHYKTIYPRTNNKGKTVIRFHINKLKDRTEYLHQITQKSSSTIQVLVNRELTKMS